MTLKGVPQEKRDFKWHKNHLKRKRVPNPYNAYVAPKILKLPEPTFPIPETQKISWWRKLLKFLHLI